MTKFVDSLEVQKHENSSQQLLTDNNLRLIVADKIEEYVYM